MLTVRRSETGWAAACEGHEATSRRLTDAIRDAVGGLRGATLMLGAANNAALEEWIKDTAAHIVGDTLH